MGTPFCLLRRSIQAPRRGAGFSLVELIVVIVITGIIASVVGLFITSPIQGFLDQSRRAELVDAAQIALTRMGRDLRGALPNSVRVTTSGSDTALELLLTLDGDRYRTEPPGTANDQLVFATAETAFNTLAPLLRVPPVGTPYTVAGSLAIYPLQQFGADPYVDADDVMTPSGNLAITPVTLGGTTEYQVSLTSAAGAPGAQTFKFDSPTRRVFLVQGPVSYVCDTGVVPGELLRYDGYAVQPGQAVTRAAFAALVPAPTPTVVVKNVQSCVFAFDPGTAQRNAVVSVALVMAHPNAPEERIRLIRQVHIGNTP